MCSYDFGILLNIDYVKKYGFIPNGARVYFLNRSQPPMFSEMIMEYFQATNDTEILGELLPLLVKEYNYWMTKHKVEIGGHVLNRYFVEADYPRPESYLEDVEQGLSIEKNSFKVEGLNTQQAKHVWSNLASGAESGWDFRYVSVLYMLIISSRWFEGENLVNISTNGIIPVDLNAIMYKVEMNIATFYEILGDENSTQYYRKKAEKRKIAIDQLLWNPQKYEWNDYDIDVQYLRFIFIIYLSNRDGNYVSNFIPLWAGCYDNINETKVVESFFHNSNLIFNGGLVSTSNVMSNQQWDLPNAWPPLQCFMIEALERIEKKELAENLATAWVKTNYLAFQKYNYMYEKYNALHMGEGGGGGEYVPQVGFGWSNGVLLSLVSKYPHINPNDF